MNKDSISNINYPKLVDDAMRGIVYNILKALSNKGLIGDHYFLITFKTNFAGVELSKKILQRYPDEMTIILQHQYDGLEVENEIIKVNLSFDGIRERVIIPLDSICSFVDPSTRFALQFKVENATDEKLEEDTSPSDSKVISLDKFRKK